MLFPQVWSITFHSWLTFVLLIWACLIWIVRSRRHLALFCSPFILLYGILLCSLHYVWGMDLTEELPTKIGFVVLKQLGLAHRKDHCLSLGVMVSLFIHCRLVTSYSPIVVLVSRSSAYMRFILSEFC